MGIFNEESDFDFAVAAEGLLDVSERGELAERFGEALVAAEIVTGWPEVDIVDIRKISSTLAAQVLEYGIVLIGQDNRERGFWKRGSCPNMRFLSKNAAR